MVRSFQFQRYVCVALVAITCLVGGKRMVEATTRIVGGTAVSSADIYPFYGTPGNRYVCGASLIWGDILITAAHCGYKVWKDGVWLGGTYLDHSSQSTFYATKRVIIHPNYNVDTSQNDVALIQLQTFVTGVPFARINYNSSLPKVGSIMTAIGFGSTSEGGSLSYTLQQVDLFTESFNVCSLYYSSLDDSVMVCNRGLPQGGKDTCQGDSGGPLFLKGTTTIAGLVSFGNGCARRYTPAVNTRVSGIAKWVQSTICSLGGANHAAYCSSPATTTTAPVPIPVPFPIPVPVPVPLPTPAPVAVVAEPVPTSAPVQSCIGGGGACRGNGNCCSNRCRRVVVGIKICRY